MLEDRFIDRRAVLRAGVGVTIGAGCLAGFSLRTLRSAAAATGKPPLTVSNVNRLVAADPVRTLAAAGKGLKAFLDANFLMTPEQVKSIEGIPSEDLQKAEQALAKKAKRAKELQQELEELRDAAENGSFFNKAMPVTRTAVSRMSLVVQERAGQLSITVQEMAQP